MKKRMKKVSVIVPVYNAGNTLDKCIKSILFQTFTDIELILVNDGSKDKSLQKMQYYAGIDNRIKIYTKENEGSIKTRRKGLELSTCEYVMFVDADDWIHRDMIKTMYNEAISNDADITICNSYKAINSIVKRDSYVPYLSGNKVYEGEDIKNEIIDSFLYGHTFPTFLCAKLYKKDLLLTSGNYLDKIKFLGEDLYFNMEMFLKAKRVKTINDSFYYYRIGGNTNKYMTYLFDDMINGYMIQKQVIAEHFKDSIEHKQIGISIMLLNTLKTCFYNLVNGKIDKEQSLQLIKNYVSNECIIECLNNESCKKYFDHDYMEAIRNKNVNYLYNMGIKIYNNRKYKRIFLNLLSKIS